MFVAQVGLEGGDGVAELDGVGDGWGGVPGRALGRLAVGGERAGQSLVEADVGEVDQPGAGQFRVEDRAVDVDGGGQADGQPVGGRGEGHVDVDADDVGLHAFLVRQRPRPLVGLFVQHLVGGALVEAGIQGGDGRMAVGGLGRGALHRFTQRAGHRTGHPLAGGGVLHRAGGRAQRGHQLQSRDGGGAARSEHAGGVAGQQAGEFGRLQLVCRAPGAGVERAPGHDGELHALAACTVGRAIDPRPRAEAPLRQLPLCCGELFQRRVVVGQAQAAPVLQHGRQAEALDGGGGQHDQRVGVLARAVQAGSTQLRLAQRPVDQRRKIGERTVEDQAVRAVGRAVAVDDGERPVGEARVRDSRGRRLLGHRWARATARTGAAGFDAGRTGDVGACGCEMTDGPVLGPNAEPEGDSGAGKRAARPSRRRM